MGTAELVRITQLPLIEERLREVKETWEQTAQENKSLVCTADTIQTVKTARADMTKQFNGLEALRKSVKKEYMRAYEAFEETYRECITVPYKIADAELKAKITDTEATIKGECERMLREYFAELCTVHGVEWLKYEQSGVRVDMTSAKQKTPRKLMDALSEFVARVALDVEAIASDAELMAEYKSSGLNLAKAQKAIRDRHEAAEAERKAAEEREERQKREAEAVAKVEAAATVLAPPVAVEPPKEEKLLTVTFRATATREKLLKLREFMKMEGIKYE